MRKIDLHIHTVSTITDRDFEFDVEKLKEYVTVSNLDCISITNHNCFDHEQYIEIVDLLDIPVFPGIEIDLESGHLLLISENKELGDFQRKCYQVYSRTRGENDSISTEDLFDIYEDLSKYIIIPHFSKKPELHENVLQKLKDYITSGEVGSPKKFIYSVKDDSNPSPSYFSDIRISSDLKKFPTRHTYVDLNEISFLGLKDCLSNKEKVFLSEKDGNDYFQIFDNGLKLSTRLNVILGERSSGKTYTLKQINRTMDNVKFIEQFSLSVKEDETEINKFNDGVKTDQSLTTQSFLKEFKDVVEDVIDIDIHRDEDEVQEYLDSLKKYATEIEKSDTYSKVKLYGESDFTLGNTTGIDKLIGSIKTIIENTTHRDIIRKYISDDDLKKMIIELIEIYNIEYENIKKKKVINDLIQDIKNSLQIRSSKEPIGNLDTYSVLMNRVKVQKFKEIVGEIKRDREFDRKNLNKYRITASSRQFEGAQDMRSFSKSRMAFSESFGEYEDLYNFLQSLKRIPGLEKSDYHKYFVKIDFQILNKHGYPVSGGERSEFNLLQNIYDSQSYDMVLIDEPESSFDNLFLKEEVNEMIRDISKKTPVVIVTHNNTVGASIDPNHVIYTKRKIIDGEVKYTLFSGHPRDKKLVSIEGEEMSNFEVMINCLEAGDEAYTKRGESYGILKD